MQSFCWLFSYLHILPTSYMTVCPPWISPMCSVYTTLDNRPKFRPQNMEKLWREFQGDFLLDAAPMETAVIGRLGNNFQFSDQRERSKNTKNSIKTWSIAETNIRVCGDDDDDVTSSAGSEKTGNPFSIYFTRCWWWWWWWYKGKLTEQTAASSDNRNKSSHHSSLVAECSLLSTGLLCW